jgi:hypothetical protein
MKGGCMKQSMATYDFELDSFVGVEAPVGTDPDELIEIAVNEFRYRLSEGEYTVKCFQITTPSFKSETNETPKTIPWPQKKEIA